MFRKLEFEIADDVVKSIVESQQWAIEHFLMMLRRKIERYVFEQKRAKQRPQDATKINDRPEVDQDFKGRMVYYHCLLTFIMHFITHAPREECDSNTKIIAPIDFIFLTQEVVSTWLGPPLR